MFLDEVAERSRQLVDGAAAVGDGEVDADVAGAMLREGHTIKGTGRVMGYEEVSTAGELLEEVWRGLHHGEIPPSSRLGAALRDLAAALPEAIEEPAVLVEPMAAVRALVGGETPAVPEETTGPDEDAVVIPFEPRGGDGRAGSGTGPGGPATGISDDAAPAEPEDGPRDVAPPEPAEPATEVPARPDTGAEPDGEDGVAEAGAGETADGPDVAVPVADEGAVSPGAAFLEFTVEAAGPEPRPVIEVDAEQPIILVDGTFEQLDEAGTEVPDAPMLFRRDARSGDTADEEAEADVFAARDLGGLLGALQTWANGESVVVNAGRLFRLINDLASVTLEVEALAQEADRLIGGEISVAELSEMVEALREVARMTGSLEREATGLASIRLSTVTGTLPQLVRYVGKKMGKTATVELTGDDLLVDRQVVERLGEPIRQVVVNAVVHGIESPEEREAAGKPPTAVVHVDARLVDDVLEVEITDDGRGIDWDLVQARATAAGLVDDDAGEEALRSVVSREGFSTLSQVDDLGGDGGGLARVRTVVEELYGTFTIDSQPGKGTTVTLAVPARRALQRALVVGAGHHHWGLPAAAVEGVMPLGDAHARVVADGSQMVWKGAEIPVLPFSPLVGVEMTVMPTHLVVVSSPTGSVAVGVERLVGYRPVAVKELGPLVGGLDFVTGAALLGGDEVVLLVDAVKLAERVTAVDAPPIGPIRRVLVVDDSKGVQQVVAGALSSAGFATYTAGSVSEALKILRETEVDAIVVDFSMPKTDGVALAHMVRGRFGAIPMVMLSGVAGEEDRRRALEAGVDAFFDKADFREGALAATLRELIEGSETVGAGR